MKGVLSQLQGKRYVRSLFCKVDCIQSVRQMLRSFLHKGFKRREAYPVPSGRASVLYVF